MPSEENLFLVENPERPSHSAELARHEVVEVAPPEKVEAFLEAPQVASVEGATSEDNPSVAGNNLKIEERSSSGAAGIDFALRGPQDSPVLSGLATELEKIRAA
jgi:hypothetical protein